MFTYKIASKEELPSGSLKLGVEFTDGTSTITEEVIPQDKAGLKHWVEARLASLNSLEELKAEAEIGNSVDFTVEQPTLTPEEETRQEWVEKYRKWVRIKATLIDTGILTGDETQVKNFLADVKAGFKPAYINFI